jgi:ABC-type uncharacterized transport system substrate-binding protein
MHALSPARRRFLAALSVLPAIPRSVGAQPRSPMPTVGFLSSRSRADTSHLLAAYHQGLAEAGYVEGRNLLIEYRWAEGQYQRLSKLAADLVARKVSVISTFGGSVSALAAKAATAEIPIVFNSGGDLVKLGLVSSFRQPSGNLTGISQFASLLSPKRLELLRDLRPKAVAVSLLLNAKNPSTEADVARMQEAAQALGMKLTVLAATTDEELNGVLNGLGHGRADGLVVQADPFLDDRRQRIVAQVARHGLAAIYPWRDYVVDGGLMSYSADIADTYRLAGTYAGKILKGARPAELPILQPSKFLLVVNLKTAKALGVAIPESVLVRADEIIR